MHTLQQLGQAVATRRHALGLQQAAVASKAGITAETLSRFERGHAAEFGSRKLLAVLTVLEMELEFSRQDASKVLTQL